MVIEEGYTSRSSDNASEENPDSQLTTTEIHDLRRKVLGPNITLYFPEQPIQLVRGSGCEVFDEQNNSYLDCINNVAHVGHAHHRVAASVASQLFTLNTNSRYLSENLVKYARKLQATFPPPLQVVYPLSSGSEANETAWRIACAAQCPTSADEQFHVVIMDNAYHGHTEFTSKISPYKFDAPGGLGRACWVHVLLCPNPLRELHLDGAAAAKAAIHEAHAMGGRIAAFFCESVICCGGQIFLPEGYLQAVYKEMRAVGAVCVADEVQCGFGRVGSKFWAFELQEVVPDIVTCGKPMGNGYPMAACITTREFAKKFSVQPFFATFGGSNAAAAAGLAVLAVIEEEGLQYNAEQVGAYCVRQLKSQLQNNFPTIVADVRGQGLMIGIELVISNTTTPFPALAAHIRHHAKTKHRVLLSTEGPYANVIKIKPPLCFTPAHVDRMVAAIVDSLKVLKKEDYVELEKMRRLEVEKVLVRKHRSNLA